MSKEPNPTVIGAFVLGGVALLVVIVLIIAGRSLTGESERYVVFFDNSIKGLKVGSNVMFRGVPVGQVSAIDVVVNPQSLDVTVPVYVDIVRRSGTTQSLTGRKILKDMVAKGLRASLQSESLITGQLYIELDFYPDTQPVFRGKNEKVPEIPSIQSGIQEIIEKAQRFVANIQNEVEIGDLMTNLRDTLAGINKLVNNEDIQNLGSDMRSTLEAMRKASDRIEVVFNNLEPGSKELVPQFVTALREASDLLSSVETGILENSQLSEQASVTLDEVSRAARSIRVLADYLEQHPEALIRGKSDRNP